MIALAAIGLLAGCTTGDRVTRAPGEDGIALLVSGNEPAFRDVAREVVRRYGSATEVYTLGPDAHPPVLQRLRASRKTTVVAIGLPAAQLARTLAGRRVVFCQVFNHEEAGLVSATIKGVSAVPPVRDQFRAWKSLDPRLRRVGVITGRQLHGLLAEAQAAARDAGFELVHAEVRSDKEALYAYRHMRARIQGLWLVPDNRVLSAAVIREIITSGVRDGKQMLAFSHELLALGALLSAESDVADISEQVLARTRAAQAAGGFPGPAVLPLTRADIRVNRVMLKRFGLTLPANLEGRANAS